MPSGRGEYPIRIRGGSVVAGGMLTKTAHHPPAQVLARASGLGGDARRTRLRSGTSGVGTPRPPTDQCGGAAVADRVEMPPIRRVAEGLRRTAGSTTPPAVRARLLEPIVTDQVDAVLSLPRRSEVIIVGDG
ncbi:hypothetical protein EF294_10715 [Gordonia oryzae]|uniref:Uncharacterized protein n=1 Tax=Gordonia oryzae TaxID=2487349 RepID=A0A3N4H7D8_9ACTN|nr:hypothetical protein [Gordonia oryzae]RPA61104.1 hypothetical protein EF294_10715 [Gordonia oryzae]